MSHAIDVHSLSKRFGKRAAVDGLSFTVPTGSVCGFLGRNGSGKTTTLRMLMDLTPPESGSATLLGLDSHAHHAELMGRTGYVSESPVLYGWMKVKEVVKFTSRFYPNWNHQATGNLLARFGLDPAQKVRHLSRGMYAQLALALAMGHDPELLILDEPATGLDLVVRRDFLEGIIQLIQQEGRTVLFSSHLVHEVERVSDHIVIVDAGRLVAAAPIDDLKAEFRRVVVRGALPAQLPGEVRRVPEGADWMVTVRDGDGRARAAVAAAGCVVVEETGLGLEEIFVELVGHRAPLEVA